MEIRETRAVDRTKLLALYPKAFPEEDLTAVVAALLDREDVLSLTAVAGDPIGHVAFTRCGPDRSGALLGPLAVSPDNQAAGIGTALVRAGFDRLTEGGVHQVFVLGDPSYYQRFGFEAEHSVEPPYALPAEWDGAWQSVSLAGRAPLPAGPLSLPAPWMDRSLWAP
ncbi:GNAT family N-acetyltransferase [Lutimaribacter marinistellae]|uniref:GNAT family N-acetyltransferase n=1 Tax=Lutimaribacter marinistellae TaxID=1820329 RepID=A0ABV7TGE6_9RHOB